QRRRERFFAEPCDRQADAFDRDGALLDAVADDLGRGFDLDPLVVDAANSPDSVDVALDDVAAERLPRAQGGLDVDSTAWLEPSQSGTAQRLRHCVEGNRSVRDLDRGQADARERDRIPDSGAGRRLWRADDEANRLAASLDGLDATDLADDPGEHGLNSRA